jgi:hypothetical protein
MGAEFQSLAEFAVDEVSPDQRGLTLTGRAADGCEYRVGLRFELPIDARTRAVMGELLTQAAVAIARRAAAAEQRPARARRDGAHQR